MKPFDKLTIDDIRSIKELYFNKVSFKEISTQLEVSDRAVRRVLKEAGINTKRKNRYKLDEFYFSQIDTPVKAYLLGLFMADGCVAAHNYLAIQLIDLELLKLFQQELKYTGDIREVLDENLCHLAYRINFSSAQMAADLAAKNKVANTPIQEIPLIDFVDAFILGYFDGDGCVYKNEDRSGGLISIVSSYVFCKSLQQYFQMGSVSEHESGVFYWRLFGKVDIQEFFNSIYQFDLGLSRKKILMSRLLKEYKNENCWKTKSWDSKGL